MHGDVYKYRKNRKYKFSKYRFHVIAYDLNRFLARFLDLSNVLKTFIFIDGLKLFAINGLAIRKRERE